MIKKVALKIWTVLLIASTLSTIQFIVLWQGYNMPFVYSMVDSLATNLVFTVLTIGLWLNVRITELTKNPMEIIIHHLTGVTLVVLIWIYVSRFAIRSFFGDDAFLMAFLSQSVAVRVAIGILLYVFFTILFYLLVNMERLAKRKEEEANLRQMVRESELQALKNQINPHFLFNSLNSLYSLSMTNNEKAGEMILNLSEFMRYSLKNEGIQFVTFENEWMHIKRYLDIEKIRFGNNLHYEEVIDDLAYDQVVPSMLLQPLLENAIKHGMYSLDHGVSIDFIAKLYPVYLQIKLCNTYDPEFQNKRGTGTGLKNVKQRLEKIYHRTDLCTVSSNENRFCVEIIIPRNEKI